MFFMFVCIAAAVAADFTKPSLIIESYYSTNCCWFFSCLPPILLYDIEQGILRSLGVSPKTETETDYTTTTTSTTISSNSIRFGSITPMNVDDYLKRFNSINYKEPSIQNLFRLQSNHLLNVPFENLDIHLGCQYESLDLEFLYDKIVNKKVLIYSGS